MTYVPVQLIPYIPFGTRPYNKRPFSKMAPLMNRWLYFIQIWHGCSLGISDDLINFWDESIKNKLAAAAI